MTSLSGAKCCSTTMATKPLTHQVQRISRQQQHWTPEKPRMYSVNGGGLSQVSLWQQLQRHWDLVHVRLSLCLRGWLLRVRCVPLQAIGVTVTPML